MERFSFMYLTWVVFALLGFGELYSFFLVVVGPEYNKLSLQLRKQGFMSSLLLLLSSSSSSSSSEGLGFPSQKRSDELGERHIYNTEICNEREIDR